MRRRRGWLWAVLVGAACLGYQWLIHAVILSDPAVSVRVGLSILNGVPHAAINLFLLWYFGRTLSGDREALITGFARRAHSTIPPYIVAYTRQVTVAWCVFFAAQVLLSAILFVVASPDAWSLFVNVLSFPLIVLMFIAEYLFRITRFPDYPHVSIWQGVEAFLTPAEPAEPSDTPSQR
jgi:uncharacterized membrane protein